MQELFRNFKDLTIQPRKHSAENDYFLATDENISISFRPNMQDLKGLSVFTSKRRLEEAELEMYEDNWKETYREKIKDFIELHIKSQLNTKEFTLKTTLFCERDEYPDLFKDMLKVHLEVHREVLADMQQNRRSLNFNNL